MGSGDKWVDRNSGPVVRPYALTGGRTEPADGEVLDLITVIVAARTEHRKILGLCRRQVTLADVASDMALPVGVVRVLLADLIQEGRITVVPRRAGGQQPSTDLLKEVLHGLHAL